MQKKSFVCLVAILSMLLPLATACGSLSNSGNASSVGKNIPPKGNLYVLAGASTQDTSSTSLHIVSFRPGRAGASVQLPNGLSSLDHQRLYTAVPEQGHTRISVINTQDASVIRSLTIPGTYATAGTMFDHAVISFDGHWMALRSLPASASQTSIALLDTQAGRLVRTIQLNGDFDLDAISPDGSRIYLLERLHDGTSHYYVRLYQVDQNQLLNYPIVDKTEINDPQMEGTALVRQVAADGSKVFTLYIDAARNIAFIHVLPLTGSYLGARCIDLSTGNDLLALARSDEATSQENEAQANEQQFVVDLDSLLLEVFRQYRGAGSEVTTPRLTLQHIAPARVYGQEDQLKQVIVALVDNALKYTPAEGLVILSLNVDCQQATLKISDTGIGIASEDLPHIFERFYRTDRARSREQGGSGLGLAIAQSIIQAYHGRIEVQSAPGQGSIFSLLLPCA